MPAALSARNIPRCCSPQGYGPFLSHSKLALQQTRQPVGLTRVLRRCQLGERRAQCLLRLHKAWPVAPGWCHSTGSQGPALTFPLQKRLQILIQALLVVQHKSEDRCQLNLCRRSRGVSGSAAAAVVRRQSGAGQAATAAGSGQRAAPCLPVPAPAGAHARSCEPLIAQMHW